MTENVKTGVIGVGYLGRFHAQKYAKMAGVELVGVADADPQRAAQVADECGTRPFADYRELLPLVDAVSVVVPTVLHHEVARTCLLANLDVLVEKPITTTLAEADDLIALARERGRILQVGHLERFNPAVLAMQPLLTHPLFIEAHRLAVFKDRGTDVDVVLDLMIHDIDIILSLVNSEIRDLSAMGRRVRTDHEDIASAQISFANGTIAQILVSRVSEKRLRQMEIMEPERYVTVNFETQDVSIHRCVRESGSGLVEIVEHPVFPKQEPLKLELQHFVTCVREGRQPLVGIRDGKRALEVCIAVLRQIGTGSFEEKRGLVAAL